MGRRALIRLKMAVDELQQFTPVLNETRKSTRRLVSSIVTE